MRELVLAIEGLGVAASAVTTRIDMLAEMIDNILVVEEAGEILAAQVPDYAPLPVPDVSPYGRIPEHGTIPSEPGAERRTVEGGGKVCGNCGGLMQRTGPCFTCSSCGNSDGGCG